VIWFYLLNLVLAWLGASAFSARVHSILDHSLLSDRLLHGFDMAVFLEMLTRPEFGPMQSSSAPAMVFAIVFLLASLVFIPGVFLGYASDHRISREEFFRSCGHNVWQFIRLFLFFAIIGGIVAGTLFGLQGALAGAADNTSNERLPDLVKWAGTLIVLAALTAVRMWFDLAQVDVVLRDERAVRKSLGAAWRMMRGNRMRLLGTYLVVGLVSAAVLVGGIVLWNLIVPPSSVFAAFLIGQITLLALLATRFWQRAVAVAFFERSVAEIPEVQPLSMSSPAVPVGGAV
jgi:hypothetical protein